MATRQTKALKEAIAGVAKAVEIVRSLGGRCMEQTLDPSGIVCERWMLPNGKSVVIYGTPHWRDVFRPSSGPHWDDVNRDLVELSQQGN